MLEVKCPEGTLQSEGTSAEGVTIAEASRRTGVSVHTLRYYERAGLVEIDRNEVGRRRYQPADLEWIINCRNFRTTGMPIRTIRNWAKLVSAGSGNERERLAFFELHRADLKVKLDAVQENLRIAEYKIDFYQGRLAAGDAAQLWAPGGTPE